MENNDKPTNNNLLRLIIRYTIDPLHEIYSHYTVFINHYVN